MNLFLSLALATDTVAVMLSAVNGRLLFEGMNAVPLMLKDPNQGVLPRLEHLISSLAPSTLNCVFPTFDTLRAFISAGK